MSGGSVNWAMLLNLVMVKQGQHQMEFILIYGGNGILGYTAETNYEDETIVIGRVGAYCGATYYENRPIWVSDNALSAKPKNDNDAKFLYFF
ncbi:MAG: hypothetical protein BWK79_19550 [Beggiatoa sp. IS2]|nr:MAG: hypothetical protein BWK79_19550 [Beggiatoa sp. IS2]